MVRKDTDLPFGDAFSPGSLRFSEDGACQLPLVLELAEKHEGDKEAFTEEIADRFYEDSSQPIVTAKNVALGMNTRSGYGLVDDDFEFTDIGQSLYELRDDEREMYERFAKHILLNLHGLKVLDIIRDLQMAVEPTTVSNICRELDRQYDLYVDESSTHLNQMRGWLSQAPGDVDGQLINTDTHYIEVDWEKVNELAGVSSEDRLELSGLSEAQQGFLLALASIAPDEPILNNQVRDLAQDAYGVYIDHKNITTDILDPLEEAGFITYEATVDITGKPSKVAFTDKFEAEVLKPVLGNVAERSGVPRSILRQSYDEIREQLDADLAYMKGQALEALTIKIGLQLDLEFAGWQVRGRETGGAEVDVIMDSTGLGFNRWQIQCKNTKDRLRTKQVAREVGLARMLQSNIILMVARSGVVPDARRYAKKVMATENITILFLTGADLDELDDKPDYLTRTLKRQTQQVSELKAINEERRLEIDDESD